jgi:hypothetical protein
MFSHSTTTETVAGSTAQQVTNALERDTPLTACSIHRLWPAMKLVQTLVVRDEEDVVDAQIAYHLNAGVDFVIATDHDSRDGTTAILEAYARNGYLVRIAEKGDNQESIWRTRMARLAATEHRADWVINTDADEFWMPRQGSLKDVLAAVPPRYGIVWALSRHFPPRPDDRGFFAERMTVRVAPAAPINDPTSPYRPHAKVAHRSDTDIVVRHGAHGAYSKRFLPLPDWYVAEVFHFPFRTLEQWERKCVRRARADKPLGQYVKALHAHEQGRVRDQYRSLVVDDAALERGLSNGSLVVDTRLRDTLQELRRAGVLDVPGSEAHAPGSSLATRSRARTSVAGIDETVIAESAGVRDADVVRLFRHLDGLQARLTALEAPDPGRQRPSSARANREPG